MTLRVAVGPFDPHDPGSDWPVHDCHTLAPDVAITPFGPASDCDVVDSADALIVWSPEYAGHRAHRFSGFKVAVVGDWHLVPFEGMPWLAAYDLICADKRGIQRLQQLGYPQDKLLYFRQFSHDPRLHYQLEPDADNPNLREIDVAFMGRDVPSRRPYLDALREWGQRTGRRVHIETHYVRGCEANVYRRSKIAWRLSQRDELPMGVYEAAACGAMAVLQHDALPEIVAAGAPVPAYSTTNPRALERFLEAWLDAPDWLAKQAARQQEWVQTETPAAHLGWLCRQIKERMGTKGGDVPRRDRIPTPTSEVGDKGDAPPLGEQRLECVALVPDTARRVLDIGCGAGGVGWALRQRNPACEVTGVDADERAADLARSRLTRFVQGGIEMPEDAPIWAALKQYGPYDAILCLDVLEHLFDPWVTLKRLRPLVAMDGVLVASVPNIRNSSNIHELAVAGRWRYFRHGVMDFRGASDNILSWEHLRFFTRDSLGAMLNECGYRVTEWGRNRFEVPPDDAPMARWIKDLRLLVQIHGGDAERFAEEQGVIQWLVVGTPDWQAVV